MAQTFENGEKFGNIRKILNDNANEINANKTSIADVSQTANTAKSTANTAKTIANAANATADSAVQSVSNIIHVGGDLTGTLPNPSIKSSVLLPGSPSLGTLQSVNPMIPFYRSSDSSEPSNHLIASHAMVKDVGKLMFGGMHLVMVIEAVNSSTNGVWQFTFHSEHSAAAPSSFSLKYAQISRAGGFKISWSPSLSSAILITPFSANGFYLSDVTDKSYTIAPFGTALPSYMRCFVYHFAKYNDPTSA